MTNNFECTSCKADFSEAITTKAAEIKVEAEAVQPAKPAAKCLSCSCH